MDSVLTSFGDNKRSAPESSQPAMPCITSGVRGHHGSQRAAPGGIRDQCARPLPCFYDIIPARQLNSDVQNWRSENGGQGPAVPSNVAPCSLKNRRTEPEDGRLQPVEVSVSKRLAASPTPSPVLPLQTQTLPFHLLCCPLIL